MRIFRKSAWTRRRFYGKLESRPQGWVNPVARTFGKAPDGFPEIQLSRSYHMEAKKQEEYYADLYLRLSREDGDKAESDSIANQRELLMDYLSSHPEIQLHEVRTDDGYSGVNYDRPGFIQMMEAVKAKEINCIIVKDFSRLGRNFIETGKYIEKIFPFMGVRFISVNDDYDSAKPRTSSDNLIVPVKNLMKNTRHLGGVNC